MSTIVIDGYADSDKVPGFVGDTKFGSGVINIQSIPLVMLLVGLLASGSTLTADVDVVEVTSREEGETYAGPGGELSRMVYRAFDQGLSGVKLMIASAAAAGGAAAATATITITGTTTGSGTVYYWVGGEMVDVQIASGRTPTQAAGDIVARFAQFPRLAVTAGNVAGVVTLTVRSAGVRGNDYILFQDVTKKPAALTSAIAGGAAVTGGGVKFTGGSGTETLTLLTALLFPARYHRVAYALNDATSLGTLRDHTDSKAGPLEGRMEHVIVGHNGSLSAATSIGQTTLNNHRFQLVWLLNSESHPSELAAAMCAKRASTEQTQPNSGYDGVALKKIAPQRARGDWANRTTQQSALDNSVTPLMTTEDGLVKVVRAITTRSKDGSTPDYRTLDTAEAVVPDYVRDRLKLVWTSEFVVANPWVKPDPTDSEPAAPEGVATPTLWSKRVKQELKAMEAERILTQVDLPANATVSVYNSAAKRIMSAVPVVPLPIQHAVGVQIRQVPVAA